jgi:hypothetical protein
LTPSKPRCASSPAALLAGQDAWHLVYFFDKIPAAPPQFLEEATTRHGASRGQRGNRSRLVELSYFVDAATGEVLEYYSAVPM